VRTGSRKSGFSHWFRSAASVRRGLAYVVLDTLHVFAMEPLTYRWVRSADDEEEERLIVIW
jgi:hypothetical protein